MSAGPALWPAIVRTIGELAYARYRHGKLPVQDLLISQEDCDRAPVSMQNTPNADFVRLLARLIPRVARRMPWRSDCLVQAMAARHWLASKGVSSRLHIGSRKGAEKGFEAHAWLTVGDLVVTGWDIENFEQFAAFPPPQAKQTSA